MDNTWQYMRILYALEDSTSADFLDPSQLVSPPVLFEC